MSFRKLIDTVFPIGKMIAISGESAIITDTCYTCRYVTAENNSKRFVMKINSDLKIINTRHILKKK